MKTITYTTSAYNKSDIENIEEISTTYTFLTNEIGDLLLPTAYLPKSIGGEIEGVQGDVGNLSDSRILSAHIIREGVKYIEKGGTIIDIGAHMGTMSMFLGKYLSTQGGGKLIAIEASPQNFPCLKHNIAANVPPNVETTVINAACVDSISMGSGSIDFAVHELIDRDDPKTTGQYAISSTNTTNLYYRVPVVTIDSLDLEKVDLIKIDAEGCDLMVLMGAYETIKRCRPVIIFEHDLEAEISHNPTLQEIATQGHPRGYGGWGSVNAKNYEQILQHSHLAKIVDYIQSIPFESDTQLAAYISPIYKVNDWCIRIAPYIMGIEKQ